MWASAPTNDHGKSTNLKGRQSRPPLQPVLENRVWVEKSPHFLFCAVGVDAYSDPSHRPNGNAPARGRMGTTDEARGGAFRVMSCGLSA